MTGAAQIRRFATLGNHLPRQCGIATFTTHLTDALIEQLRSADGFVVAMNDGGRRRAYPSRVRFQIGEDDLSSYRRAADFLNVNQVDVLSVQRRRHRRSCPRACAGSAVSGIREVRVRPVVRAPAKLSVVRTAMARAPRIGG